MYHNRPITPDTMTVKKIVFAGGVLMKANITEPSDYVSDIKVTDIYPASKEDAQLSCPGLSKVCPRSLVSKGNFPKR